MGLPNEPPAESFPKACRVLRRREFLRIQGQGQRIHGRRLIFQFLPGEGPESRLGITVSKKVGDAPVRSQIKRWIRESFRRHPELRPSRGGDRPCFDVVITAKRGIEDFGFVVIHDEIVYFLKRYLANPVRPVRSRRDGQAPRPEHVEGRGPGEPRDDARPEPRDGARRRDHASQDLDDE